MKKGLLGLLVVALTVVGCQNYDDQFDELNKKISDLASDVSDLEGVQTAVSALDTKLTSLQGSVLTDSDLTEILDEVAAVEDLVEAIDMTGIESEVDSLNEEVDEILERLSELLSANAVIQGDIVIRNVGDLLVVEDLIGTEADDPLVTIQGNVMIQITGTDSITDAAHVLRVNAVMAKIKIVQGTTTVTTKVALDLPELMYVSGDFDLTQQTGGSAPTPKLRTINGTFHVSGGGVFNYSQLANTSGVEIAETSTITHIDFGGISGAGKVTTAANSLVLANATIVRVGGVLPTTVTLAKCVDFDSTYSGAAQTGTEITIGGANATFDIGSTKFTGAVTITTTGDISIPLVTEAKGLTLNAAKGGDVNVNGLAKFTAATTISATTVQTDAWKSNTSTVTIIGATAISAPALTSLIGDFVGTKVTVFDAQKLATGTNTGTLNTAAALTLHLKSMDHATGFGTATSTILDWATMTTLKVFGQAGTTALNVTEASSLTTLGYTGAEVTAKGSGAQANSLTLTASNTKLVTLELGGYLGSLTATNTQLVTVNTTGAYIVDASFTSNAKLTGFTFAHSHVQGDDESTVVIHDNDKITSVDMSNLAKVGTVRITDNAKLTSIVAPSTSVLATSVAVINVNISGNKLSGNYTAAQEATGTVSYQPASISAAVLTSFKPWIEANVNVDLNNPIGTIDRTITAANAATGSTASGADVVYNINVDLVTITGATGTNTLSARLDADNDGSDGPDGAAGGADNQNDNNVAGAVAPIRGAGSGVNTKNELDSVI
jgi:hypothetical protein